MKKILIGIIALGLLASVSSAVQLGQGLGDYFPGDVTIEGITKAGIITAESVTIITPADGNVVTGPTSATDNAVARFDSTTGKIMQNSGVTIDDSNNMAGANSIRVGGAEQLKFWSYVHTLTAQNITDAYANITVTAVTLNNVRAVLVGIRDISTDNVMGADAHVISPGWQISYRLTSTTNVEVGWGATNLVAGDRLNILIIEAI